jgi:hypothetical protein
LAQTLHAERAAAAGIQSTAGQIQIDEVDVALGEVGFQFGVTNGRWRLMDEPKLSFGGVTPAAVDLVQIAFGMVEHGGGSSPEEEVMAFGLDEIRCIAFLRTGR